MQLDIRAIATKHIRAIMTKHGALCLTVGAPVLCALLIASISVPLAMWAPIVVPADGVRLASVESRPVRIDAQPKLTEFETRLAAARAYLVQTAQPGYTMTQQGASLAIERLHPDFALRLANAVREARAEGLTTVGVFSAYRPPALGIGGFRNKFQSLHAYGLAVDVHGIGRPGSAETRLWHRIASRNDLSCPYGLTSRREWNHCQVTRTKIVLAANPLTKTIQREGPLSLEQMWGTAKPLIIGTNEPADVAMTKLTSGFARQSKAQLTATNVISNKKGRFGKPATWHKGSRHIRVVARTTKPDPKS